MGLPLGVLIETQRVPKIVPGAPFSTVRRNDVFPSFATSIAFVSTSSRRVRQYVGLALVIFAYLGGIVGWTWAVQTVDADRSPSRDTTEVVVPDRGAGAPSAP